MSEANNTYSITDRAAQVAQSADVLYQTLLNGPGQVDYLTLFTNTAEECDALNQQARNIGALVFDKQGSVYQLDTTPPELPTDIIRIGKPSEANTMLGSADYIVSQEQYPEVKRHLAGAEGYREIVKNSSNPEAESYRVITVTDTAARAVISFPSLRVSERVMGIQPET